MVHGLSIKENKIQIYLECLEKSTRVSTKAALIGKKCNYHMEVSVIANSNIMSIEIINIQKRLEEEQIENI